MTPRIRTVFFGSPAYAIPTLTALLASRSPRWCSWSRNQAALGAAAVHPSRPR
ncbi:MAG: hypothetical protein U0360_05615 [Dehalococcoidia bacterium]